MNRTISLLAALALAGCPSPDADPVGAPHSAASSRTLLVEAEAFSGHGGWALDTQFIEGMGSPYLLAHGLGVPVADATTVVTFPAPGMYRVFVRTVDWAATWDAKGHPGRFRVLVDGKPLEPVFGESGQLWHWQAAGAVEVRQTNVPLVLHDLTGFDGRVDAILFTSDPSFTPPSEKTLLPAWRRTLAGVPAEPEDSGTYDLVVCGGGYAGTCSAISAARMGLKVALIQNRSILGGNGSSEVRVWAMGTYPDGLYPVGEIVQEIEDNAFQSPGPDYHFADDRKLRVVRAEPNISLFLNHHAYAVEMKDTTTIAAVRALDVRTGRIRRFAGRFFVDATGHGTIGDLAGADQAQIPAGRMGMSNMFRWENAAAPQDFPACPWALDLKEEDFPYPKEGHGQWFWESGFDKDPVGGLEETRDWNLRAVYGAWDAIKNKGAYAKKEAAAHRNARLSWLAYVGGTRETRQLLGDVVLSLEDIQQKREFPDGCVLSTWSIDLHFPDERYNGPYLKTNAFISIAKHARPFDPLKGYAVPYRCFYSRNLTNLFMAGRDLSVTHEALGTVRVQKTLGMVGVVVGRAAGICIEMKCSPRDVYEKHLPLLIERLKLPGRARRGTVAAPIAVPPADTKSVSIEKLPGIVIDDDFAAYAGDWTWSDQESGYIGRGYRQGRGEATATFPAHVAKTETYDVQLAYRPGPDRSAKVAVTLHTADGIVETTVDQTKPPPLENGFVSVGRHRFDALSPGNIVISNRGADGVVVVDAVQLVPPE